MNKNNDPWSKRIWYVECLILFLLIWAINLYPIAMLTLMVLSIIATAIISIYLKYSESKNIKSAQISSQPFSQQLIDNSKEVEYNEEQYHTLTNTLNVPTSRTLVNEQQITPTYTSAERIQYVTFEGEQFSVRSKALKICNRNVKNLTDIQGLEKLWYLKKLNLSHNDITSLKGIESLINLKVLKLSDNKIQEIEYLRKLPKLEKLYLDNNQLKELKYGATLPHTLKYLNIAKNPIEKFHLYTKETYQNIHFGPKKWFPKQELKHLRKIMRSHTTYHTYGINEGAIEVLLVITVWAGITFGVACLINLIIWGTVENYGEIHLNFWALLFTSEWSAILFIGAGTLTAIGMAALYFELS